MRPVHIRLGLTVNPPLLSPVKKGSYLHLRRGIIATVLFAALVALVVTATPTRAAVLVEQLGPDCDGQFQSQNK